jgi:glycosyltransferase involved in cell wall biosynthesis
MIVLKNDIPEKMDLISIIIPIYNVEKYLKQCLDSVINQTYSNLEIILVNDGSTDSSGEICEQYKKSDKRIRVIHKKNGGLSSARNEGIRQSSGEWIGFIDSDDYVDLRMYEILWKLARKNEADIAMSYIRSFNSYKIEPCMDTDEITTFNGNELIETYVLGNHSCNIAISVCDRLYKRDLVRDVCFLHGKLHEDVLYTMEVFCKCKKAVYINHAYYFYRTEREGSITFRPYEFKNLTDLFEITTQTIHYLNTNRKIELANIYAAKKYIEYGDILGKKVTLESRNLIKKYLRENRRVAIKALKNKKIRTKERILLFLSLISPKLKKLVVEFGLIFYKKIESIYRMVKNKGD